MASSHDRSSLRDFQISNLSFQICDSERSVGEPVRAKMFLERDVGRPRSLTTSDERESLLDQPRSATSVSGTVVYRLYPCFLLAANSCGTGILPVMHSACSGVGESWI
jgi:hypothetical protein